MLSLEQWLEQRDWALESLGTPGDPNRHTLRLGTPQVEVLQAMWLAGEGEPVGPGDVEAPYPNEHSARLKDPKLFDPQSFRRVNDGILYGRIKVPKTIAVIWGKLKGRSRPQDYPIAQALRFPVKYWTVAKAKKWLEDNDIKYIRFEPAHSSKSAAQEARQLAAERLAAAEGRIELTGTAEELEITAAGEGEEKVPRFRMVAYTGAAMHVGWLYPVVLDLAGMRISRRPRPILYEHDRTAILGHTESVTKDDGRLIVEGTFSGDEGLVEKVVKRAGRGFPWRASVGTHCEKLVFVESGKKTRANGREFTGPLYVARKSRLVEVSFVACAADDDTSATVAAGLPVAEVEIEGGEGHLAAGHGRGNPQEIGREKMMSDFATWLKEKGFEGELTEAQKETLEAAWRSEQVESSDGAAAQTAPGQSDEGPEPREKVKAEQGGTQDLKARLRHELRHELAQIEAACQGFEGDEEAAKLKQRAINGEIDLVELQAGLLRLLRERRPRAPAVVSAPSIDRTALEAACYLAGGFGSERAVELTSERAVEAAEKKLRGMGVQELIIRAAALEGVQLGRYQDDPAGWLKAAFSTLSVPGILSSVANKALLEGYNYVEDAWRKVCRIASVKDFKTHNRYRLVSDLKYQKVGPDGQLKSGELSDQTYSNQADTYGILFGLDRRAIINDDLGAFTDIPRHLGRGGAEAIAEAVWDTLLGMVASGFFAAANGNYSTGANTALGIDSLTAAEQLFLDMTQPSGRPVGVQPKILLVPTALKVTAEQLMKSRELRDTTSSTKYPTWNPHVGKFEVVCSAYIGNTSFNSAASQKAWYLLADPNVLAAIEVAFLNGKDRPTVEQTDADFDRLGIVFRGYIDFGVAEQEPRAAVKMKGEA